MPSAVEVREWHTRTVISADGEQVGKLEDVYVSKDTGDPEFLLVERGVLGHRLHLVPAAGATMDGEDVRVAYDKATIDAAPTVPADDDISPDEERQLFDHYGRPYAPTTGMITITRWVLIQQQ
jgi:sporulation protein YlmC with PRC-barrel domain